MRFASIAGLAIFTFKRRLNESAFKRDDDKRFARSHFCRVKSKNRVGLLPLAPPFLRPLFKGARDKIPEIKGSRRYTYSRACKKKNTFRQFAAIVFLFYLLPTHCATFAKRLLPRELML